MNTQLVLSELARLASNSRDKRNAGRCLTSAPSPRRLGDESKCASENDLESFVTRGYAKIVTHYERVLANPNLTQDERADLEARLARERARYGKTPMTATA
jgi:hypothetical protein